LVFLSNIFKTSNEKLKFTPFFFIKSKYEAKVSDFEIRMYYFSYSLGSDLKNVAEQKFNFRTRHFTPHYFKNHSKTEFY